MESAQAVLQAFITAGVNGSPEQELHLPVCLVSGDWECRWPRPPASATSSVILKCSATGLHLSALQGAATSGNAVAQQWMKVLFAALPKGLDLKEEVPWGKVFGAAGAKSLSAFAIQITHGLARAYEEALVVAQAKKIPSTAKGRAANKTLTYKEPEWDAEGQELDARLAGFLGTTVEAGGPDVVDYSMPTDKAWVNGLPLQNSVFVYANGVAVPAAPQVASDQFRGALQFL